MGYYYTPQLLLTMALTDLPLLKNMYRMTADFLLIFRWCPLRTTLLHTTRRGSTLNTVPEATSTGLPEGVRRGGEGRGEEGREDGDGGTRTSLTLLLLFED